MLIDFDEILACAQLICIYKMYFLNFYQIFIIEKIEKKKLLLELF